jgi:hypothetical protein
MAEKPYAVRVLCFEQAFFGAARMFLFFFLAVF